MHHHGSNKSKSSQRNDSSNTTTLQLFELMSTLWSEKRAKLLLIITCSNGLHCLSFQHTPYLTHLFYLTLDMHPTW